MRYHRLHQNILYQLFSIGGSLGETEVTDPLSEIHILIVFIGNGYTWWIFFHYYFAELAMVKFHVCFPAHKIPTLNRKSFTSFVKGDKTFLTQFP